MNDFLRLRSLPVAVRNRNSTSSAQNPVATNRTATGRKRWIPLLAISTGVLCAQPVPLDKLENKTILLFTPHPDDDTFCCAGTLALLAKRQNNIHVVIYTNDDKGSRDPDMTSERLARIRQTEEENSCRVIGVPARNIQWLQFHDGMLEYANPLDLVEQVTRIIRTYRPDLVMSIDPGSDYVRWHKTDHRMAANNTADAIRAAEFRLYFPNQILHENLQPWKVPLEAYFYTLSQDANYWVNIDDVIQLKLDAAAAHVSQFRPSIEKYRSDWDPKDLEAMKRRLLSRAVKRDDHYVESFRLATKFNPK